MARALREAFDGQAIVLTPDLPLHPKEALKYIRMLIDKEKPDLLIGNSCGAFLAQMLSPVVGIPALLGNPHFKMTDFLRERIGEHKYKAPRMDGNQKIVIDESLIHEFEQLALLSVESEHAPEVDLAGPLPEERTVIVKRPHSQARRLATVYKRLALATHLDDVLAAEPRVAVGRGEEDSESGAYGQTLDAAYVINLAHKGRRRERDILTFACDGGVGA